MPGHESRIPTAPLTAVQQRGRRLC
jgi:hypothetical protein